MLEIVVQQHPQVTGFLKYDLALRTSPPSSMPKRTRSLPVQCCVSCFLRQHSSCSAEPSSDLTETNSSSFTSTYPGFETAPAESDCLCTDLVRLDTALNLHKHRHVLIYFLKPEQRAGAVLNPSGLSLGLEEPELVITTGRQLTAGKFLSGFVHHVP